MWYFCLHQDLDDPTAEQFVAACRVLKVAQPSWARASLNTYVRWATKLHLNAHDIVVPCPGSGGGGGEGRGGGGESASRPQPATGDKRRRRECGSSDGIGRGEGAAHNACGRGGSGDGGVGGTALLSRPGTSAVAEGLYPSVARLNHSCEPNVQLSYDAYGCLEVTVWNGKGVR